MLGSHAPTHAQLGQHMTKLAGLSQIKLFDYSVLGNKTIIEGLTFLNIHSGQALLMEKVHFRNSTGYSILFIS